MDFNLTEEQQAVRDLSAQILGDMTVPARLTGLEGWIDRETWTKLGDAGLLGVALPEPFGAGLGFLGAHVLAEQVGAVAAPLPVWETLIVGALPIAHFGTADQRDRLLPDVVAGNTILTAALIEDGAAVADTPATLARRTGAGWELEGAKAVVALGSVADLVLVPATTSDGAVGVWLVDPRDPSVTVREQEVVGGRPSAQLQLSGTAVGADALLGPTDGSVLAWLLEHGAAGLASLAAGACAGALRLSAQHTSTREQFGRPLATFQAVAQRMADAYIDVEGVSLTALQAAWRLSEGAPAAEEIAIAKWWAAEAGHRVLHAAHHVHGGVGVDREYPLHRYFALVKHIEFQLGHATTQLLRIGAALAAEPA